jgi:hypothetical protein
MYNNYTRPHIPSTKSKQLLADARARSSECGRADGRTVEQTWFEEDKHTSQEFLRVKFAS